jgi:hypothetical protein
MANRACANCGKEVVEGKRFCGCRGQAIAVIPSVAAMALEDHAIVSSSACPVAVVSEKSPPCNHNFSATLDFLTPQPKPAKPELETIWTPRHATLEETPPRSAWNSQLTFLQLRL